MLDIQRQTIHKGYDRRTCWVHARAGMIPEEVAGTGDPFTVVLTMHALRISGSDVFYPIHNMWTDNGGQTWSGPAGNGDAFRRRPVPDGIEEGVCDFWPGWHVATGVLLGTGHTICYIGDEIQPFPRPKSTAYSVYDPAAGCWAPYGKLDVPTDDLFFMEGAGSCQRYDLPNGDILLPTYSSLIESSHGQFDSQDVSLVMRCSFDGQSLSYLEHGDTFTMKTGRGFAEPSLIQFGGRFLLSLRNDDHNYVTVGEDGLHFVSPQRLVFDDGDELGSYNTQTHWLTLGGRLYLVYTRRGANNDHVFRHRAPLFIAEFDHEHLCVLRETEQILVPERGARLGNFGITTISERESWVTTSEWMQTTGPDPFDCRVCEKFGSDNSIYVAKVAI